MKAALLWRASLLATTAYVAAAGHISPRPSLSFSPNTPYHAVVEPPPRNKTCFIESHGDGKTDDSPCILNAFRQCNNGGRAVFRQDQTYFIGTAMDWTFLNHIDIDIQGRIVFGTNTTYWQANSFRFGFQNVTSFFKLGGNDVWIYGGGTVDGNGQIWYDTHAKDIYTLRPVLFGIDGLHNSVISDLVLRYSPQYYHFVANSTNVVFNNIDIAGRSTSKNKAKNTDGWDTYRSDGVTIQNSVINNGDDCVAFKPNSTNILVQNLFCNGSHGISVGSLGQYVGTFDIVEHIWVANISMHNASDGARIKVWPNTPSAIAGDLQGGGGDGCVRNITYTDMEIDNVDYAIEIDQCYGQKNLTLCLEHPSPLTISDVVVERFRGRTSKKYQPLIAALACSSETACANIRVRDIDVRSPNGTRDAYCLNMNATSLDVTCTDNYKGVQL
ncbi:extracellular exo-polygalacturonase, partial [Apiospora kogelbergensis]|uniref:extracellular exo-polygalacturonase n=1 Tax=Apiospora kogelbergensis TaxID=1337665 RepID=UPI00312DB3FD